MGCSGDDELEVESAFIIFGLELHRTRKPMTKVAFLLARPHQRFCMAVLAVVSQPSEVFTSHGLVISDVT